MSRPESTIYGPKQLSNVQNWLARDRMAAKKKKKSTHTAGKPWRFPRKAGQVAAHPMPGVYREYRSSIVLGVNFFHEMK